MGKEIGQKAIEYISVERIIAYSRMVKADKEMSKI